MAARNDRVGLSSSAITRPRIYKIPHPGYTLEALRYKVEGSVRVEVLFGSDGAIQHALVARGLGFGLDEEALKAARGIEYKPGEVGGQPASMWMGVEILFGPMEIEKKREGTPRIALNTVESPATIASSFCPAMSADILPCAINNFFRNTSLDSYAYLLGALSIFPFPVYSRVIARDGNPCPPSTTSRLQPHCQASSTSPARSPLLGLPLKTLVRLAGSADHRQTRVGARMLCKFAA
jgi:TonB family protein